MRHLIIISRQRSGSNHLISLLDSHPDITRHGEAFRENYRPSGKISRSLEAWDFFEARAANPTRFIAAIAAAAGPDARWLGFKLFPKHMRSTGWPLDLPELRIVRLRRPNFLAIYSSAKSAKATGQGAPRVGVALRCAQVVFDAEEFGTLMARNEKTEAWVDARLGDVPGAPVFDVDYAGLNDPAVLDDLQRFLDLEPIQLDSTVQKRNPSEILARFFNPDAVRAQIEALGRSDWMRE